MHNCLFVHSALAVKAPYLSRLQSALAHNREVDQLELGGTCYFVVKILELRNHYVVSVIDIDKAGVFREARTDIQILLLLPIIIVTC